MVLYFADCLPHSINNNDNINSCGNNNDSSNNNYSNRSIILSLGCNTQLRMRYFYQELLLFTYLFLDLFNFSLAF